MQKILARNQSAESLNLQNYFMTVEIKRKKLCVQKEVPKEQSKPSFQFQHPLSHSLVPYDSEAKTQVSTTGPNVPSGNFSYPTGGSENSELTDSASTTHHPTPEFIYYLIIITAFGLVLLIAMCSICYCVHMRARSRHKPARAHLYPPNSTAPSGQPLLSPSSPSGFQRQPVLLLSRPTVYENYSILLHHICIPYYLCPKMKWVAYHSEMVYATTANLMINVTVKQVCNENVPRKL